MTIATTLRNYLDRNGVDYDLIPHLHTTSSQASAQAAHVSGDQMAKSVLLEDEQGYMLAVIPATHRLDLGVLHKDFDRLLGLATEDEIGQVFKDCDQGAIPALGEAYGLPVIFDERLADTPDIYFEAGDHEDLVHVRSADFVKLMSHAQRGRISHHL